MTHFADVITTIRETWPQELAKYFFKFIPVWIVFVFSSLSYLGVSLYQLHQEYSQIKYAVAHHHNLEELVIETSKENGTASLDQITSNLQSLRTSLLGSSKALQSLTVELSGWAKILETDINIFKSSADLTPFGLVECDNGLNTGEMRLNNANPKINVIGESAGVDLIRVAWHLESAYKDKDGTPPSIVIDRRIIEINHNRKGTIDGSARKHDIMATLSPKDYARIAPDIHINDEGCGLTLAYLKPAMIDDVNKLFREYVDFGAKLEALSTRTGFLVAEVAKIGE